MFNQYDYFQSRQKQVPEINTLSRVTGITGMEEFVQNIRDIKPLILAVEDDADGYLDLSSGNVDHGFHTFMILDIAKLNDSTDRVRALNNCMKAALKLFRIMMEDGKEFGDPCYGFDKSRIDYQRIGPLANNTYGYLFSYILKNENFRLVDLPEEHNDPVP